MSHSRSRVTRSLAVIVRSERLILRRHLEALRRQLAIAVVASILGAIGLVMLNVAGFYALWSALGPALAALIVALVNLGLAGLLIVVASGATADRDLAPVVEVRDMAIADLQGEAELTVEEARYLAGSLRRFLRDPMGSIGVGLIGPLIAVLLNSLRSGK